MPPDLHSLFLLLREGEASFSILKPQAMNNTGLLKTLNCHLKGQYFSLKDPFSWRKIVYFHLLRVLVSVYVATIQDTL